MLMRLPNMEKICATLRRQGTPIGVMDMLIATHAKAKGLIIVSNAVDIKGLYTKGIGSTLY